MQLGFPVELRILARIEDVEPCHPKKTTAPIRMGSEINNPPIAIQADTGASISEALTRNGPGL